MHAKNPFKALQTSQLQSIKDGSLANAEDVEAKVNQIQADLEYLRKKSAQFLKPHTMLKELQKVERSIATHALHYIDVTFKALLSAQEKQQLEALLFRHLGYEIPYYFHKSTVQSMLTFTSCHLSKHKILSFFIDNVQATWCVEDIYVGCNEKICNSLMSHSSSIIQHLTKLKQQLSS